VSKFATNSFISSISIIKIMKGREMGKWIFMAYKNEDDEIPYFKKEFHSHIMLKNFSAKHSAIEKKKYPDYCSDYIKIKEETE